MSYKRAALRRAKRLAEKEAKPRGVFVVDVYHDANCPQLRGGVCTCHAEVRPARAVKAFEKAHPDSRYERKEI